MKPSLSVTEPSPGDSDEAAVVAATRCWLERAVIGLNLCPFARVPYQQQRVRFRLSRASSVDGLLEDLADELRRLYAADPADCETTLVIHPHVLADFYDFNDFLDLAEQCVVEMGLEGELQVASFHPDYRFEGTDVDDIGNFTNRSPYPTLHLLREASVERAVATVPDTDAIYQRNIDTLNTLGHAGWAQLWQERP